MTIEEVQNAISNINRGSNVKVTYERPVKLKKAFQGMPLTKKTTMQCRIGINYDHVLPVKEARQEGTLPKENAGIKGMEWEQYPFLLKGKNDRLFLRCYTSTFKSKSETTYSLDGQVVNKEDFEEAMLASEKSRGYNPGGVFNLPIEGIQVFHRDYAADHKFFIVTMQQTMKKW
jgi:hypothetical protein